MTHNVRNAYQNFETLGGKIQGCSQVGSGQVCAQPTIDSTKSGGDFPEPSPTDERVKLEWLSLCQMAVDFS